MVRISSELDKIWYGRRPQTIT